ncbi:hypothetical protein BJ508DRAFT_313867 [Ascobolus immersus RN42]|uniref:GYF domain-containing protein n=1 Tax=Ascobolus immersus RN42 TaxID=1160509 RepID=A0A3N4HJ82_ASCIM|nr:hypothetical protein BJ508DRAFT_313867 [Ascobolus immersus RN42]
MQRHFAHSVSLPLVPLPPSTESSVFQNTDFVIPARNVSNALRIMSPDGVEIKLQPKSQSHSQEKQPRPEEELLVDPLYISWEFRQHQLGQVQGPFSGLEMHYRYTQKKLPGDVWVRRCGEQDWICLADLKAQGSTDKLFLQPLPPLSPAPFGWEYVDLSGALKGPYLSETMSMWLDQGLLFDHTLVRVSGSLPFVSIRDLKAKKYGACPFMPGVGYL